MARLSGRGAMALVELDPQSAEDLVGVDDELTVVVNASLRQSVIAGPPAKIDAVIADLQAKGRLARLVDIEVASHHPMIDSVLPDLRAALADLMPGFPTIPVITTTSGRLGTPTFDADYWADNLRNPVRFTQAVTDAAQRHGTFIEVSPHPRDVRTTTRCRPRTVTASALQRGRRHAGPTPTSSPRTPRTRRRHRTCPSPIRRCRARRGCTPTTGSRRPGLRPPTCAGSFIALPGRRAASMRSVPPARQRRRRRARSGRQRRVRELLGERMLAGTPSDARYGCMWPAISQRSGRDPMLMPPCGSPTR
jgi:hypothetical protein